MIAVLWLDRNVGSEKGHLCGYWEDFGDEAISKLIIGGLMEVNKFKGCERTLCHASLATYMQSFRGREMALQKNSL